ncbi:hypothetical protein V8J82_12560 [Gymnodinialimonas sp. 2305UL16-5]|uniref:hypothetical protein n=1 Tax=Gymnodinialimonas mytili TaxID=3126503 RepID=UPI0030B08736
MEGLDTAAALWWAVVISGIYHGVNPGMGWPLAVSAALMEGGAEKRRPAAPIGQPVAVGPSIAASPFAQGLRALSATGSLYRALGALALGHLLAMLLILLPFSLLFELVRYQSQIQTGAAILVIGLGAYLLINRRHPRILARIRPNRLALWSFLAAMAHGAGLMLVPIYLGICGTVETDTGHAAAESLIGGNILIALAVSLIHTAAMMLSGGGFAIGVYHWVGLKFLRQSWFNLDVVWATSLIAVGAIALFWQH